MSQDKVAESKLIEFRGRTISKSEFQDYLFDGLKDFVSLEKGGEDIKVLRVLWEIVRNIYDHNFGWGYLSANVAENGEIEFEIGNLAVPEEEKPNLKSYHPTGRFDGDGGGSGLGRNGKKGFIFEYAEHMGLNMSLDPKSYTFRFKFKTTMESQ